MSVVKGSIFRSGRKNGVAAVLIALLLAGCGYHMEGGRGSFAPSELRYLLAKAWETRF